MIDIIGLYEGLMLQASFAGIGFWVAGGARAGLSAPSRPAALLSPGPRSPNPRPPPFFFQSSTLTAHALQ